MLHKTGTWEDVENNKPRFLRTESFSEQRRPSKVGLTEERNPTKITKVFIVIFFFVSLKLLGFKVFGRIRK